MFSPVYASQVRLLLGVLPIVGKERFFALKGGTAINLFVQDMPRLSVDIDLAYLPLKDREAALAEISGALDAIGEAIQAAVAETTVQRNPGTLRLVVNGPDAQIKIEPNTVFRGIETLVHSRRQIIARIQNELSDNERRFLLSVKQGTPDWRLLPVPRLEQLPAIQWKLRNVERMPIAKHKVSLDKLKSILEL